MRICFVSPRYGEDILGGAELLIRQWCEQLIKRPHKVTVFSTCAHSRFTWDNEFEPGTENINGVTIERFKVSIPSNRHVMAKLQPLIDHGLQIPLQLQEEWVINTGYSQDLIDEIARRETDFDVFIFAPYLLATTVFGAHVRPQKSMIMPLLHDEPYATFEFIQNSLKAVNGLIFNTEPEQSVAERLLGPLVNSHLVGTGIALQSKPDPDTFRQKHNLTSDFITYAGRRDDGKNFPLLLEFIAIYNQVLNPTTPIELILIGGDPVPSRMSNHVRDLGFISEEEKLSAFAASTAVVTLSCNESLSLVVLEAWLCKVPVIVHADGAVTRYHCEQSNGGVWIKNVEQWSEALNMIRKDKQLRNQLAQAGNKYVRSQYSWPAAIDRFEKAITTITHEQ